jgi:hypothetical protein
MFALRAVHNTAWTFTVIIMYVRLVLGFSKQLSRKVWKALWFISSYTDWLVFFKNYFSVLWRSYFFSCNAWCLLTLSFWHWITHKQCILKVIVFHSESTVLAILWACASQCFTVENTSSCGKSLPRDEGSLLFF